ncbi:MAG: peptidoglycan-binding protein [Bryobacteraceae bacterium]|jgi:N-acetylmuramoyl-L-alanine amidase
MPVHIVKQGDCMSSIADQYGFFWETLWNDEHNSPLRDRRKDPNVLMAGDHVFIPEKRPKEEAGETTKVHTFRLKGVPVKLNLRLLDACNRPRAGLKYSLTVDGHKFSGVTDDDGRISHDIPPRSKRAQLKLPAAEEYDLDLGYMNPVEYTSGVQGRLKNLGYYHGEISGTLDDPTRKAIRRFQDENGLTITGEPDADTRAALLSAHEG